MRNKKRILEDPYMICARVEKVLFSNFQEKLKLLGRATLQEYISFSLELFLDKKVIYDGNRFMLSSEKAMERKSSEV